MASVGEGWRVRRFGLPVWAWMALGLALLAAGIMLTSTAATRIGSAIAYANAPTCRAESTTGCVQTAAVTVTGGDLSSHTRRGRKFADVVLALDHPRFSQVSVPDQGLARHLRPGDQIVIEIWRGEVWWVDTASASWVTVDHPQIRLPLTVNLPLIALCLGGMFVGGAYRNARSDGNWTAFVSADEVSADAAELAQDAVRGRVGGRLFLAAAAVVCGAAVSRLIVSMFNDAPPAVVVPIELLAIGGSYFVLFVLAQPRQAWLPRRR